MRVSIKKVGPTWMVFLKLPLGFRFRLAGYGNWSAAMKYADWHVNKDKYIKEFFDVRNHGRVIV
jgi:hypothetical protein